MQSSGVFDVQSHTRSHAKIFCDATVTGFITPGLAGDPLDQPLDSHNGAVHFVEPDALGTPLYLRRSRMSDARRFLPDDATAENAAASSWSGRAARRFSNAPRVWRTELERLRAGQRTF